MSRIGKLKWNTISSLILQLTTLVCGFILPRLILGKYGSEVNGLVNSITQFLHVIAFLDLGVGAVVQSSLYKPLAIKDNDQISRIVRSANRFFSKIAIILSVYILCLVIVYPFLIDDFDHVYTGSLILAIGISAFSQYYFGVSDRLLLVSDQRGYIQYFAQTGTLILNTIICAILIKIGLSIHFVKLTTSIIYILRPVLLRVYVKRHYSINKRIELKGEPISQKWNGMAQHIASVVLDQTDVITLTVFSSLANVSVYSVYHLVIYGVKNLFMSLTNGIQALMGEYLAIKDKEKLMSLFDWTEWLIHTGTTLIFGCTGVLIVPFVMVYTRGINDANYIVPLFSLLITIAHAGHCLRLPYNLLILAAGHYRQTQSNYIIAALLNICISIITVKFYGLIGVAIGTLIAMAYQTIWMAFYDSRNILNCSLLSFAKHVAVDILTVFIAALLTNRIQLRDVTYRDWILQAVIVFMIWTVVCAFINFVFYREKMTVLFKKITRKF